MDRREEARVGLLVLCRQKGVDHREVESLDLLASVLQPTRQLPLDQDDVALKWGW